MPRITISVDQEGSQDSFFKEYDFSPEYTIGELRELVHAETGLEASQQMVLFNGEPLNSTAQTLKSAGIHDDDMLFIQKTEPMPQPQQSSRSTVQTDDRIELIRQRLSEQANSPQVRQQLRLQAPDLEAALNDPARFKTAFMEQQAASSEREAQLAREMNELNNDMSEEGQTKIYEAIRQKRVQEEADEMMNTHPELFGRVTMLYIDLEVNGHPIKAFVDSGAQATIMSPSCAEACGVTKSIDVRYAGIARGVGTANILGRVHKADIKIGNYQLPCAFTVMEGKDVDMLLGLDMLKRYQACIDLQKNQLVLGGGSMSVPFLGESEIPKYFEEAMDKEPTTSGPGGAAVGTSSGAVKAPATGGVSLATTTPSTSKSASSFAGVGQTLGASSSPSKAPPPQTPNRSQTQPARPPAPTPGQAQFPEEAINFLLVNFGTTREEAIEALKQCGGNLDLAASLFLG